MTPSFPVALDLRGRRCLVVGSGDEALARTRTLVASGAAPTLVAERPSPELERFAGEHGVRLVRRAFEPHDLDGAWLAVLTERDRELGERIAREAEARCVPFCAVDQPGVGSFSHLAIARAGAVFAAIGTQGEAPALARRLREILERAFERADLARFAERLAELRRRTPPERRRDVLNEAVAGLELDGELVVPPDDDSKT